MENQEINSYHIFRHKETQRMTVTAFFVGGEKVAHEIPQEMMLKYGAGEVNAPEMFAMLQPKAVECESAPTPETMSGFRVGMEVVRSKGDYVVGRVGTILTLPGLKARGFFRYPTNAVVYLGS